MKNKNVLNIVSIVLILILFSLFLSTKNEAKRYEDEKNTLLSAKQVIKNDTIVSNINMEASPFVWKGSLKYFVAERNDKEKKYELAIYDFKTNKREVSFGKGLGLAAATVIDDTLYISATKDWYNFGKSEIYLIKSKDLKNFSKPLLIHKADKNQKIFNTTLTKNDKNNTFILAYESHDDKSVPFSIYFLQSNDGMTWEPVSDAVFGKETYVACPTIKYVDGYYYMNYSLIDYYDPNCLKCRSYITRIARSKDLSKWETSYTPMMITDRKDEGYNTSDIDFTEFEGRTYIYYSIGDQSKWGGLKYAVYNGSEKEFVEKHFIIQ